MGNLKRLALLSLALGSASCGSKEERADPLGTDLGWDAAKPNESGSDVVDGRGPTMVTLVVGGRSFRMDSTEVTQAQYAAFLADAPSFSEQGTTCASNESFVPGVPTTMCAPTWAPATHPDHPVACVDWCDAQAFCAWAGKRLCGRIGESAPLGIVDCTDPDVSEWFATCTQGGKSKFGYGDSYDPARCNTADSNPDVTKDMVDVASMSGCHGESSPYDQVFDLQGNVSEWVNMSGELTGEVLRGFAGDAHWNEVTGGAPNDCGSWGAKQLGTQNATIGIRCCAD